MSAQELSSATDAATGGGGGGGEAVSGNEVAAGQVPTSIDRPTETQRRILGAARHSSESSKVSSSSATEPTGAKAAAAATTDTDGSDVTVAEVSGAAPSSNAAAGGAWCTDHFSSPVVREREWVIMEASNGVKRFVLVKTGSTEFKFSKKVRCKVQSLVGASYGQVYEIRDSTPRAVEGSLLPLNIDDFITHGSIAAGNDNRNLVDDSSNQKLAMDDIVKMKTGEGGGAAVIAALVSHSSTFKTKTEFSQAKYLKRKQQKYMLRFRLLECTPFTIARMMFEKHSAKIGNIRWDTVAQLLSYGDIRAQSSAIVCDELSGLIAGSVTHKIAGYGSVFYAAFGRPQFNMFEKFNFSSRIASSVVEVDLGNKAQLATLAEKSGKATSLVIACQKSDPWVYFLHALPLLQYGSHFSVYHEYVEPLAALYMRLQEGGYALRLQLSDTWTREIVVASNRTRPVMQTSGHGGYLLTGIYVSRESATNYASQDHKSQPRRRQKRKR